MCEVREIQAIRRTHTPVRDDDDDKHMRMRVEQDTLQRTASMLVDWLMAFTF